MPRGLGQDRTARAAHAGIDDDHMNRALRKVAPRLRDHKRAFVHLEWRDLMRDVHDPGPGRNAENHALDGAGEMIGLAEVGCESDQAGRHLLIKS